MILGILLWIDDYNHYMNSVDLANQHREPYNTQQIGYRTWLPLLHWILDQAAVNAYRLAVVSKSWKGSHLDFRCAIYKALLNYSQKKRPWTEPGPHYWAYIPTRQTCAMCSKKERLKKQVAILQDQAGIELFELDSKRLTAVSSICGHCKVPLCKTTKCFKEWHAQKG